jgi:DNA-directed RNA polymerase specialized sigma24 family protein
LARQSYDGFQAKDVTVNDQARQTDQFERKRPPLRAVAYSMLGSISEADDILQEAWLRVNRSDNDNVANPVGWLTTTTVGRVCLDILRARRSRRENHVGNWLPEPIVNLESDSDPEQEAMITDAVGLALLVVLETLSPPGATCLCAARHVRNPVRGDRTDRRAQARCSPATHQPGQTPYTRRCRTPIPTSRLANPESSDAPLRVGRRAPAEHLPALKRRELRDTEYGVVARR